METLALITVLRVFEQNVNFLNLIEDAQNDISFLAALPILI